MMMMGRSGTIRLAHLVGLALLGSLLISATTASRVLNQDAMGDPMQASSRQPMGRAEEIIDEGADEDKRGDAASGDSAPKEDLRALPPFEYVTSCVPLNILVLGSDEAGPRAGESANGESADESGPYSVWIEAEPGVIEGLKTEVINGTLHVDFVDAGFRSSTPIKVIVNAPADSLKGVHNSGVISTMVVLGFSPKEDFDITNTSPFGALIVDDLKADSKNYSVNIASFGNGFTAVLGDLENLSLRSTGSTGDVFIDGAGTNLNVDLRGTGNVIVDGSDHLLITGDVAGPGAGLVAFTRGVCSITTSFEADESDDFEDKDDDHDDEFEQDDGLDDNDMSRGQSTMGLGPRAGAMSMPDMMVHGCVRLPSEEEEGDAGSAFGVPDVEGYMTWTCGLMVRGTFNCLRGDAARDEPALDCSGAMWRPECQRSRNSTRTRVQGRAAHGIPGSQCAADMDPSELRMSSVVEGMDDFPANGSTTADGTPVNGVGGGSASGAPGQSSAVGPEASVQGAFGVVEGTES